MINKYTAQEITNMHEIHIWIGTYYRDQDEDEDVLLGAFVLMPAPAENWNDIECLLSYLGQENGISPAVLDTFLNNLESPNPETVENLQRRISNFVVFWEMYALAHGYKFSYDETLITRCSDPVTEIDFVWHYKCIWPQAEKVLGPEAKLRKLWTEKGIPKEEQDKLINGITEKAQPGAQIGPWKIGGENEQ